MTAYYNEVDPYAAQWLRNLIDAGHIAPGDVDERSIEDVRPDELMGYRQCHFFAGIGIWSYALRAAGWPDDRSVWTGSCPCQPFSTAGQGAGFDDERHLWPAFFHLISQRRPSAVFGEQVASADADPWIDLVCYDMESLDYAFGALAFPAASVGAPHIRDRLYWLADAAGERWNGRQDTARPRGRARVEASRSTGGLGNASNEGLAQRIRISGIPGGQTGAVARQAAERAGVHLGRMANTDRTERPARDILASGAGQSSEGGVDAVLHGCDSGRPGPANGFWRASDWLACRDGRWRPVEPGTFPLATGAVGRVGKLRAYGNGLNAEAARIFIKAAMTQSA